MSGNMKYEICKKFMHDNHTAIWPVVAWSDTWKWAKEIADSLNCISDGEFAVFKNGKVIKTIEEAMKE